ncbi:MAG: hypothetical protein ACKODA_11545 [Nevskiaceae bacterium]
MHLIFTKGRGKFDRMDVFVNGVCTSTVQCPKQGIIPHDMLHFAVETTLQLRGFITRTLEGDASGFRMTSTAESDGVERLVEVLQADGWAGWTSEPSALLDLYRVTCEARRCPPLPIGEPEILAVRDRIHTLTTEWQSVKIGESIEIPL